MSREAGDRPETVGEVWTSVLKVNTLYRRAFMDATRLSGAGVTTALVTTGLGIMRGERVDNGVLAFRGIPFAGSTAGAGRWAPPTPPTAWTGERDARRPGPVCPQPARPFSTWAHGSLPRTGDDCLSLNVWAPADSTPESAHPVLVFIHGGGWALGWGSNPLLDGSHLAPALDAVVVTINYRLGSLGWLWLPEQVSDPDQPAGNWGLLDQLAALRWVAEHIAAFGGDPGRVTLAGESAGAGSALHLLAHPGADGLFARVIAQSPPLHELVIDAERGRTWSEALIAAVGGTADDARALPAQAIVDAHEDLLGDPAFRGTRGGAMPIVDPASLPVDPAAAPEVRPEVPVLIGTNADEGTFFFRAGGRRADPDDDRLTQMVAHLAHTSQPESLIEAARGDGHTDNNDVLCTIVTEAWFAGPVRRWSAARAAAGASVHRYRIDQPSAEDGLGATHSLSVPLLFASWRDGGVAARLAGDRPATAAVSAAMAADWGRFVHGQDLEWPALNGDTEPAAVYGSASGPRTITASLVRT
jgi:para-nitrobenzyl esterase